MKNTVLCPKCRLNEMDGTIVCWDCFSKQNTSIDTSNKTMICECGVHLSPTAHKRIMDMGGCQHKEPETPKEEVYRTLEFIFSEKPNQTQPLSPEERHILEHAVEPAEIKWTPEMRRAYYMNRIDMALIVGDKEEFLLWSGKLNRYKTIRERKEA